MNLNNYGGLFRNSSSQTNNTFNLYSSLGELHSIKSGTYKKLLREYYKKTEKEDTDSKVNSKKDSNKSLTSIKAEADILQKSALKLSTTGKDSIFNKKNITTTDEKTGDKTTKLDYDMEDILKTTKSFIASYNDIVDKVAEASDTNVLRNGVFLTKTTSTYNKSLSKIGITIGSDNKLTINEEKFKSANVIDIESLLNGKNSFADTVAAKASQIGSSATLAMNTTNSLYQGNAKYSSFSLSDYNWYI